MIMSLGAGQPPVVLDLVKHSFNLLA